MEAPKRSWDIGRRYVFPWAAMFIVIKVWGTAFASWSWFWWLLPVYPDLYLILGRLGLLR